MVLAVSLGALSAALLTGWAIYAGRVRRGRERMQMIVNDLRRGKEEAEQVARSFEDAAQKWEQRCCELLSVRRQMAEKLSAAEQQVQELEKKLHDNKMFQREMENVMNYGTKLPQDELEEDKADG